MLFTSLLVQATKRMTALARDDGADRSATPASGRAFRRSFLLAFADRIGERLAESARAATEAALVEHGERLLPVLARQQDAAEEALRKLFPHLRRRTVRVSDLSGWAAGRAAADLADLDTARPLPRAAR
jgi:hypothetical protein